MEQQHGETSPPENQASRPSTRRPRGRPAGSKNKPKPPQSVKETPGRLNSHVLQIPPYYDVVKALTEFSTKHQLGICILNATGCLLSAGLSYHPTKTLSPEAFMTPHVFDYVGRFEILSLKGAILPPTVPPTASGLSVVLSNGEGKVIGGKVAGRLLAAETVTVLVSSFIGLSYARLDDNIPVMIPQQMGNVMNPVTSMSTWFEDGSLGNVMPGEEFWNAPLEGSPRLPF